MKKFLLSSFVVATFAIYIVFQRLGGSNDVRINLSPSPDNKPSPSDVSQNTPVAPPPAISRAGYLDGAYTGSVADAYYGNVQVKVTIQGGRIADVQFLDYPHDRRTSIEINTQAVPQLRQEAIQAQSANVDTVSGATQTSGAFRESLASALAQAKS